MKKIFATFALMFLFTLMTSSVLALDLDATKYSFRGDLSKDNVIGYFGEYNRAESVDLHYNARLNLQRGINGAGEIYGKVDSDTISVKWSSTGNDYGMSVFYDDQYWTVMKANARIIKNGEVSYGNKVYVIYLKDSDRLQFLGDHFYFSA